MKKEVTEIPYTQSNPPDKILRTLQFGSHCYVYSHCMMAIVAVDTMMAMSEVPGRRHMMNV
jgi:hypothetical protein